ncbi:MAG: hypothetical protein ABS84_00200 [Rubrivivax sp. SCN 71-131]|nr:MAG: hypothetical protein ABS84_00200 [Rubrivivax sp. SCN 71-131]
MKSPFRTPSKRGVAIVIAIVIASALAAWVWVHRVPADAGPLRLYGNVDIREVQLAFRQAGRVAGMAADEEATR